MNIHDPQWWKDSKWHRGLAEKVEAQENHPPANPSGTPRHPRTIRKAQRQKGRGGFHYTRVECPDEQFRALLAAGYYDDYRKAFDHADD